jgi:hypothetical protein
MSMGDVTNGISETFFETGDFRKLSYPRENQNNGRPLPQGLDSSIPSWAII